MHKKNFTFLPGGLIFALSITLSFPCPVNAGEVHDEKVGESTQAQFLFGNHACPVTGDPVDPDSFVALHNEEDAVHGRVYLCCDGCSKKVEENLEKLYNDLYRMDRKTGKPKQALDLANPHCPMSDDPAIAGLEFEYNGKIVHFCCAGCGQDFLKDPDARLAGIVPDATSYAYDPPAVSREPIPSAIAKSEGEEAGQLEDSGYLFGNRECPAMGDPVDPDSFVPYRDEENAVYGRVYMCCDGCKRQVEKDLETLYRKHYRTDSQTGEEKEPVDLQNPNCPMSGGPVIAGLEFEYNGMIVHFCCSGCGQDFLDTPDAKLAEIVPNPEDYAYERPAGSGSSR